MTTSLNDWLERSLSLALREGSDQMKPEHWERRAPLLSQCEKKFSQILQAENELKEDETAWEEFRRKIWDSEKADVYVPDSVSDNTVTSEEQTKKRNKKGVGIRNPHRDAIGEDIFK